MLIIQSLSFYVEPTAEIIYGGGAYKLINFRSHLQEK